MKYILTAVVAFTLITIGCKNDSTNSDDKGETNTHSTVNVKDAQEYFSFSSNSGSTDEASAHDVIFYSVQWRPAPQAPLINDPRFRAKDGLSIAVLNDTDLEDVTDVPAISEFVANFASEFGEWYETTDAHIILPYEKVYIVNTSDGKFPAFEIKSYYDEVNGDAGVYNIEWKYLN